MQTFNPDALAQSLNELGSESRVAYALSCAERLFPNYLVFARHHSWGDPEAIRDALDLAWRVLFDGMRDLPAHHDMRYRVQQAEPDTNMFDSIYVSPALDAAASAGLTLDLLSDDDARHVVDIASLARDTVDMYIQEHEGMAPNDPLLERRILEHPLMQKELQRQAHDLIVLRNMAWSPQSISSLQVAWRAPIRSNIGWGLS